ncbi:amidohydrolase [Aeromonas sp. FDAARGOS 1419]|uniref:amidohydrolase n=1 Tax=Aeromonas sp. FDAARGOS 1419 TaxID=2778068 RepID=UPI001C22E7B0|nr:amidohydrolase [Aeromonas sp. FDAARGOS 1419]QWZ78100.1 amidohydrolase [Aeromonas sp. FDAARGOS 1419]
MKALTLPIQKFCDALGFSSFLFAAPLLAVQITTAPPQTLVPAVIAQVNALVDADADRLAAIYKDLHQHPEIAFTEVRTASIVAKELKRLGFKVTEGIAHTGVVGVLENGPGPVVWFRADMDAVSVKEETGLPYAATKKQRLVDGSEIDVMHACGHDAHVTWLLGMANTMAKMTAKWSGTLVVYAQPAEEVGLGAQAMVDDQLWERGFPKPDYAFAVHGVPGPVGYVASVAGVRMAGTDQLDVNFKGVGGHGSSPEMTIDPIVMAAQAVLSYQTIISRNLDPQSSAVLTVGAIEAGRDNNVIPAEAKLKLNLRWFSPDIREKMLARIESMSRGIAISAGVPDNQMPTLTMKGHAGPLVNDATLVDRIKPNLTLLLGGDKVVDNFPSVMGSEDFQEAFAPLGTPYVYQLIGIAPPKLFAEAIENGQPAPYSNHNPSFFVDLTAIPVGTKINTITVLSLLMEQPVISF